MRFLKFILSVVLVVAIFLVFFDATFLILQKYNPIILRKLKTKLPSSENLVQKFSGNVLLSYQQLDGFHFKVDFWDTRSHVYKDFIAENDVVLKKLPDPKISTDSASLNSPVSDLKVGDEVELSYTIMNGANRVLSVSRTMSVERGSLVILGQVVSVSGEMFTLRSVGQIFNVGLEGSARLGPKYAVTKIGGKTITRGGILIEVKDFSSLSPESAVEVIYSKNVGQVLIAQSVLILE